MPKLLDITGQRYGKLIAIRRGAVKVFPAGQRRTLWIFRCDCGKEVTRTLFNVRRTDTKSCGCARKGIPSPNRLSSGESSFRSLFQSYTKRARTLKVPWGLSKEQFRGFTKQSCYYCGATPRNKRLTHKSSFGAYIYNGIDRLVPACGYVLHNVVSCCGRCNISKNDMTESEFIEWVKRVYAFSVLNTGM